MSWVLDLTAMTGNNLQRRSRALSSDLRPHRTSEAKSSLFPPIGLVAFQIYTNYGPVARASSPSSLLSSNFSIPPSLPTTTSINFCPRQRLQANLQPVAGRKCIISSSSSPSLPPPPSSVLNQVLDRTSLPGSLWCQWSTVAGVNIEQSASAQTEVALLAAKIVPTAGHLAGGPAICHLPDP